MKSAETRWSSAHYTKPQWNKLNCYIPTEYFHCKTIKITIWIYPYFVFCIIATMKFKNIDNFCYTKEAIMCYLKSAKINTFRCQKNKWDTKENTGNSMKNTLYVLWYAEKHLSGCTVTLNSVKNQAHGLNCYRVIFVWRHQSISQLFS